MSTYAEFLDRKRRVWTGGDGVPATNIHPLLFDWQAALVRWALRKGKAALFCDTGLGKTFMQLSWAQHIPGRVLILAPLCVAEQTVAEGYKLGLSVTYARSRGETQGAKLAITNYERLDAFDVSRFAGVVLDESSILKAFDGKTRGKLIAAFAKTPYRLCCTATPSPNDISELANHAEFLGLMTRQEFLATWFVHDDQGWRMKGHAVQPFYRWMASWAMAMRRPSDIGYADDGFVLPPLTIEDHVVEGGASGGVLFPELGLKGIIGRLRARRASVEDRVAEAVRIVATKPDVPWLLWCGLNDEADAVTAAIPGAMNVRGCDSYERKRDAVLGFVDGRIRVMVSKMRVLGFGMNFQHCADMAMIGLGDSYEQYYQAIRRCWRFGQRRPVTAHIIVSNAERAIVSNVRRKQADADAMAKQLLVHMRGFEREELAS